MAALDLVLSPPSASPRSVPAPAGSASPGPMALAPTPSSDGGTEFRPVVGGGDSKSGEALLVGSYATIWVLVMLFVVSVWRRNRGLEDRVARLEKALEAAPPGGSADSPASGTPTEG